MHLLSTPDRCLIHTAPNYIDLILIEWWFLCQEFIYLKMILATLSWKYTFINYDSIGHQVTVLSTFTSTNSEEISVTFLKYIMSMAPTKGASSVTNQKFNLTITGLPDLFAVQVYFLCKQPPLQKVDTAWEFSKNYYLILELLLSCHPVL